MTQPIDTDKYHYVFNEETLRHALVMMGLASITGTLRVQTGREALSSMVLLEQAADSIKAEGRTESTEALFALADSMIGTITDPTVRDPQ